MIFKTSEAYISDPFLFTRLSPAIFILVCLSLYLHQHPAQKVSFCAANLFIKRLAEITLQKTIKLFSTVSGKINYLLDPIGSLEFFLKKMGQSRPLFLIFVFSIQLTVNIQFHFLPMTGFERRTSGVGSDCSTN